MSAVTDSCAVCGDRATKLRYSHYGATSCFSCRAFYRRAIEKGSFRNYACSLEKSCVITIKTRKKCPFCRFAKCKRVGMTHSSEKGPRGTSSNTSDRVPTSPTRATIEPLEDEVDKEINGVLATFSASTSLMAPRFGEAFAGFSKEDEVMVRKLVHLDRDHSFHIGESLCDASLTAIRAYIDSACSQTPLDFTAICWAYTKSIRKLTRFAQNIDDFNTLDVNDRKTLLLENLDPMFNIRVGHFFSCDATTLLDQLECLAVFDVSNLQSYIGGWIPQVRPLLWNQFFVTPWANSVQHERKFEGLMSDIKGLSLDKPTATILTVVSLLDTDGTKLKNQSQVIDIQKKYIGLLYRYLCHTRDRFWTEEKFPEFLNMLSNLKEMSDIMKNKTIKWSMAWPQIQNCIDLNEEEIDKNFFDPH